MNVIVSDFDDTLFKRNYGLLEDTVAYLEQQDLPVWIITYRAGNQIEFILSTLSETKIEIKGIIPLDSRKKEVSRKAEAMEYLIERYNIVEALDDDPDVVIRYIQMGVNARQPV